MTAAAFFPEWDPSAAANEEPSAEPVRKLLFSERHWTVNTLKARRSFSSGGSTDLGKVFHLFVYLFFKKENQLTLLASIMANHVNQRERRRAGRQARLSDVAS